MDSTNTVALTIFTGKYIKYGIFLIFFVWNSPQSSLQENMTVPIPLEVRYFTPIVSTLLDIWASIFSVKMSSYDNICAFAEF